MAQHLQACLICPRAAVWLKTEGPSELFGVLPIQYPWPHFPFINHLVMASVGWSIKVVPLLWPRVGCGPGYTLQNLKLGLGQKDWTLLFSFIPKIAP